MYSSFEFTFNRVEESHSIKTRMAETGMLPIPRFNSTTYGLKSHCINSWNMLTFQLNLLEKAKNNYIENDLLKNALKK